MSRPVTLFTGQWADLPFETACAKAMLLAPAAAREPVSNAASAAGFHEHFVCIVYLLNVTASNCLSQSAGPRRPVTRWGAE